MTSQRDMLRQLVQRHGRNEEHLIKEYAAAERRGAVKRLSKDLGMSAEEYAARLIADAKRKRWIRGL